MTQRRHDILRTVTGFGLLVCLLWCSQRGASQTPAGTRIFNVAKATFHYRTGAGDSVHSNLTETIVQAERGAAAYIELMVSPGAIIGDGGDVAQVRATVRDVWGDPVPDSVKVNFTASAGSFTGGGRSITVPTISGIASIPIRSDIVARQFATSRIVATVAGTNGFPISAETTVLFFPGAIQGVVTNASTGLPVRGARVVAFDHLQSEQGCDSTSAVGRYLIPLSQPGRYWPTITCSNQFGDEVRAQFSVELPIPGVGGIAPVSGLNIIAGTIVDRSTGMPIREAGVRLMVSALDLPKLTLGRSLPAIGTTDPRGMFLFDSLAPGTYEIRVADERYAGSFVVHDTIASSLVVDANVGIADRPALAIVKSVNKRIAEIGDGVTYTLEIQNTSVTNALTGIRIVDDLPLGFAYVEGSSRNDQEHLADPRGSRTIQWVLQDTLMPGKTLRLTYMATIGAGGMDGDGVNHVYGIARNVAGDTVRSAEASIDVVVRPGVFTDRGIVIGKVILDANANGSQDPGDDGIAGVELWTEDGTHVITGDDGKFSLPEVLPGQHVIRIDRQTLPTGAQPLAIRSEAAGDGISRFIRLVEGGVVRADFYILPPRQATVALQLAPAPSLRVIRAKLTIRWGQTGTPSSARLADTLTSGCAYLLSSLRLNSLPLGDRRDTANVLSVPLSLRKRGDIDTVEVDILCSQRMAGKEISIRPAVVLSYPGRRDAWIRETRSIIVPRFVPGIPTAPSAPARSSTKGPRK